MRKSGDIVKINGKEYCLGKIIGEGSEGCIFDIEGLPNYVIKVINTNRLSDKEAEDIRKRLIWLKDCIGNNLELKQKIAAPKGLLDNELGYVMLKATEHSNLQSYLTFPKGAQEFKVWYKESFVLKKRLQISSFMFRVLETIHISGMIFSDLSPDNIMVHNNKNNLIFVDTDNIRKGRESFHSVLGTDGFMAPEVYHAIDDKTSKEMKEYGLLESINSNSGKISVDSDVFSAAIIAFQLLTLQHPFVGDVIEEGNAEQETDALHCNTDYILKKNTLNYSSNPFVRLFDDRKIVTEQLKNLFYRTFVDGKNNPVIRPTAIEFYEAFSEAIDLITKCDDCGIELIYDIEGTSSCWDCSKVIDSKICFQIYSYFDVLDRNELIGKIVNEKFENITSGLDNRFGILSQIVLNEGEIKTLYLKHFEKTNKRSHPYATLTLISQTSGEIEISIKDNSLFDKCCIKNMLNGNERYIMNNKAFRFNAFEHLIYFEKMTTRIGQLSTVGGFFKVTKI